MMQNQTLIEIISIDCKANWNPLETLIAARKLLRGFAKMFVEAQPIIDTWAEMQMLIKEFGKK